MGRKPAGVRVERLRERKVAPIASPLRLRLQAWTGNIRDSVRDLEPALPETLNDRQQDGAEILIAIADSAGGVWPERARQALIAICCSANAQDADYRTELLGDIRDVFGDRDKMPSADICQALVALEDKPWASWGKNKKPMNPHQLATLLRPFEVEPRGLRMPGGETPRGYYREQFESAWASYVPKNDAQSATVQQTASLLSENDFSDCNATPPVAVEKSAPDPHKHCIVAGVALPDPVGGPSAARNVEAADLRCPNCQALAWSTYIGLAKHLGTACGGVQ
jgi:hypothetical protein